MPETNPINAATGTLSAVTDTTKNIAPKVDKATLGVIKAHPASRGTSPPAKLSRLTKEVDFVRNVANDPTNGYPNNFDDAKRALKDEMGLDAPLAEFSATKADMVNGLRDNLKGVPGAENVDLSAISNFGDCFKNIDELIIAKIIEIGMNLIRKASLLQGIDAAIAPALTAAINLALAAMSLYEEMLALYEWVMALPGQIIAAAIGIVTDVIGALDPCTYIDGFGNPIKMDDPNTVSTLPPQGAPPVATVIPEDPYEVPEATAMVAKPPAVVPSEVAKHSEVASIKHQIGEITSSHVDEADLSQAQSVAVASLVHAVARKLLNDAQRGYYNDLDAQIYTRKQAIDHADALGADGIVSYQKSMALIMNILMANSSILYENSKLTTPYAELGSGSMVAGKV
jgi:hypothetical protein